jgi:hypothetical protein
MKTLPSPSRFIRRITLLLCSAVFFLTLPVDAKDKRPGSKHRTRHYSPRYDSHSRQYSSGQHNHRPVYSSQYRGHSNHRYSNYGRSNHSSSYSSILNQLLRRL